MAILYKEAITPFVFIIQIINNILIFLLIAFSSQEWVQWVSKSRGIFLIPNFFPVTPTG